MMVVDETSGKVIGDMPDTKGIHGIALASDLGKGFTSNGGDALRHGLRLEDDQAARR